MKYIVILLFIYSSNIFAMDNLDICENKYAIKINELQKESQSYFLENEFISYYNVLNQLNFYIKEYIKCVDKQ